MAMYSHDILMDNQEFWSNCQISKFMLIKCDPPKDRKWSIEICKMCSLVPLLD